MSLNHLSFPCFPLTIISAVFGSSGDMGERTAATGPFPEHRDIFLSVSCFREYQIWTLGRNWMAPEWVSYAWLPRRLGVFTLFCLDSCLSTFLFIGMLTACHWQDNSLQEFPSFAEQLPPSPPTAAIRHIQYTPRHACTKIPRWTHGAANSEYKAGLQIIIPVEPEELPSLPKRLFRGAGKGGEWLLKPWVKPCSGDFHFWVPLQCWGDQFGIPAISPKLSFLFSC